MSTVLAAKITLVCSAFAWAGLVLNAVGELGWLPTWPGVACTVAAVLAALVTIIAWSWGRGGPS